MNKSACVQKQKAKDVEGLGSKLDVAVRCLERTTFGIKGKPYEFQQHVLAGHVCIAEERPPRRLAPLRAFLEEILTVVSGRSAALPVTILDQGSLHAVSPISVTAAHGFC